ncbi:holdfast anchoring protein HfaB [Caulobacter sp. S45]|uniref:holdfast anchoring protein HfaB n=1 Tax=Caulobacter sp. S45 TaxID=1641861 RepID=UPI0015758336|nr:holdfast anchoring protein HfaB [Caulobacter sp. S45]
MASVAAVVLSGCVSPVAGRNGNYASPIGDAPVTANPTPYSAALVCLSQYAQHYGVRAPRIAVGRIADYTGKAEDNGGREITQGASLMAISALAKAGAPLVERYDTSVSELELKYANNKLISDTPEGPNTAGPDGPQPYRKIMAGQVPGSDFYLVGGITELNYNIRSSGLDAQGGKQDATKGTGVATGQLYVMNVGIDLRLVETKTMEVVDVVSYQKQIVGRQVGLGLFSFFGSNVIDVSAGEGGLEPIQLAVRSMVERSVLEMMANLYGAPGPQACLANGADPVGPPTTTGLTGGFYPAYNNLDQNNGQTREEPNRWDAHRDLGVPVALRGRY